MDVDLFTSPPSDEHQMEMMLLLMQMDNVPQLSHLYHPSPPSSSSGPQETATQFSAMREMIFRIAAMQPVDIDPDSLRPPKRRNVKISTDPQSVAARHRRERISHRIRILQRLVPGGSRMDTASMLDEAIHYVKFLKNQVQSLERVAAAGTTPMGNSPSHGALRGSGTGDGAGEPLRK